MTLLVVDQVSKQFGDGRAQLKVLIDVSLDVVRGEFVAVWGGRRSGKTTLLQIAAGRTQPDQGRVIFDDQDMTSLSRDRRARLQRRGGIALVDGSWRPTRHEPVIEHVALPLLSDGLSLAEARIPAWHALVAAGVSAVSELPVGRLSPSEWARVSLARALVHEPRLLVVDEPAAMLRPLEATEFYALLQTVIRERKIAMLLASEDVAPLRKADRVHSISDGALRPLTTPGVLVQFPGTSRQRS